MSRLAKYQSVIEDPSPIFQVVSTQNKFEVSAACQAGKNCIHFTHIRILDGSGDGMVCQLNMNLAHDGSKLCAGDIVQLHMFTSLTYVTSSGGEVTSTNVVLLWLLSTPSPRLGIGHLHLQLLIQ